MITAFNKIDKVSDETRGEIRDFNADKEVFISAGKDIGLKSLLDAIEDIFEEPQKIFLNRYLSIRMRDSSALYESMGSCLKKNIRMKEFRLRRGFRRIFTGGRQNGSYWLFCIQFEFF